MTILFSAVFAVALFCGVLACMRIGWRTGRMRLQALGEDGQPGLGTLDGAFYGLIRIDSFDQAIIAPRQSMN